MSHYYTLAQTEPGNPVPVVAEDVGPYGSLDEALAASPGMHEATADEVAAYERYWEAWHVVNDPSNASGQMDDATARRVLAECERPS